ncbi:MAG: endonuclease III [Acidobacteria bacterium]|nr:endonuclease III [Acidobacteriota bacterium]
MKGKARPAAGRAAARARVPEILRGLHRTIPDARCTLGHSNPLELLVATILSAQCTDERVNRLTPALFRKYRTAADFARAPLAGLEADIRPTGFFRSKARSIVAACRAIEERHGGRVPDRMEDLVELAGVGRKTANVILGTWFHRPAITVDTHVKRLAGRMGLSAQADPDRIEADLAAILPEAEWTFFSHAMILHGRTVCHAPRPACERCFYRDSCPFPRSAAGKKLLAKKAPAGRRAPPP